MNNDWRDGTVATWLAEYARAWRVNLAEDIAAHWHARRFVFYKAEEVERMMTDWDQVLAYWRGNEALHEAVVLRFEDVAARPLGESICAASARMRWDIRFADDARMPDGSAFAHRGRAMGGENHVALLLAREGGETGLVGWVEAPDAPLTWLRRRYFEAADGSVLP